MDTLNKKDSYYLTKAQLAARRVAGLEIGAEYNVTDDVDSTVTQNSDNLVTSGAVYTAIHQVVPAAPSANGTYVLKCTVSGGEASYSWVLG